MIERFGRDFLNGRELLLTTIADLAAWPRKLPEVDGDVVAFVAMDARGMPEGELEAFAEKLIRQRAAYFCAWGPDCHRVHDAFDRVRDREESIPTDESVMTTWHDDEALDDAMWFALYTACPHDRYIETCTSTLFIVVANEEWATQIRAALQDPDALTARVVD